MTSTSDTRDAFDNALLAAIAAWRLAPTPEQIEQLRRHYELMLRANRTTNLTRITEPQDAAVKHMADALALCPWAQRTGLIVARVLDVGTGAGFPAVPLAVMRPRWQVTAIDGTRKKITFVRDVVRAIGLDNLRADATHADHWKTHQRFDVVLARAVGAIAKCLPFAARLTAPGGWFVSYKTPSADDTEHDATERLAVELNMVRCEPFDYALTLRGETLSRRLVVFRKHDAA